MARDAATERMISGAERFPKAARLCRRREYLNLGRTGERRHAAHFLVLLKRRAGTSRLGITVSRKVGDAVVRNGIKRRVRELFRRDPARLVAGHDIIVIAKPGAGDLAFADIARELATAVVPRHARARPGS